MRTTPLEMREQAPPELLALATRVPFTPANRTREGNTIWSRYTNESLGITYEIGTKIIFLPDGRGTVPAHTKVVYRTNGESPRYGRVWELFSYHPDLRAMAEKLYPVS